MNQADDSRDSDRRGGLEELFDVLMESGGAEQAISTLPPGRRDASGFWIPAGYDDPSELFTPQQRRLQAKQRDAQRGRRRVRDGAAGGRPLAAGHEPR